MKKILFFFVFIFLIELYSEDCYAEYSSKRNDNYDISYSLFLNNLNNNLYKNTITLEEYHSKIADFYSISLPIYKEILQSMKEIEGGEAKAEFVDNEIVWKRGLDFYINLTDNYDLQPDKFEIGRELGEIAGKGKERLLFTTIEPDSIIIEVKKTNRISADFPLLFAPFRGDSIEKAKIDTINNILFFHNNENNLEPLFILSDKPIEYKNSLGKFFVTKKFISKDFLNQEFNNFYNIFFVKKRYDLYDVYMIWVKDDFSILRFESFALPYCNKNSTFGYYKIK